ncbi:AAA family ATPase, partial [Bacteriovoracaceae bacterium]|nr:AAA family ATPase [Bacteriovoracaceae bacterium]
MLSDHKLTKSSFLDLEEIFVSESTLVYRGKQEKPARNVIIKTINEEYPSNKQLANLRHEYEILQKIRGKGIVEAIELVEIDNKLALIIEDIEATSIKTLIDSKTPISINDFLDMSIQITDYLGNIHHHSIIHKDINPNNIIFSIKTRTIKIIDFGISTMLSRERQDINVANKLEGSLPYISPEQTGRMNCDLDYRSDYYSLGITLYEILTGKLPFFATDTIGWIHCHIAKTPPLAHSRNNKIPEMLSRILFKLMAKNTEDRYQSSVGIKRDLERCLKEYHKSGNIPLFELAQHDISEKFKIPQKLYGRENELRILNERFRKMAIGTVDLLLVSGHSGIGKSALIRSVHQNIVRESGHFIEGKFEQFQQDVPYSTFIQCFNNLINQLLTEPIERLGKWKREIQTAIHPNGEVITNLVPALEKIIGKQEPLQNIASAESQNRFLYTVKNFVKAIARPNHPLIIFLDDLQWSDVPTLKLIEYLINSSDLRSLLLIGSYRDNEVKAGHPLRISLQEIEKNKVIHSIYLNPLIQEDITQIVSETVHADLKDTEPLSRIIFEKTKGNPFFVETILKTLYQEDLLVFNNALGKWEWDIQEISSLSITDNVVDFIITNINKIPSKTNRLLQLASCIGKVFDLKTLSLIYEDSCSNTSHILFHAIKNEIIIPLSDQFQLVELQLDQQQSDLGVCYQFQHDRVQQAANSMLDHEEKKSLHLKIARLFRNTLAESDFNEKLLDIVFHYNEAIDLIHERDERIFLATLNLEVGKKARYSNAYEPGFIYLEKARQLLDSNSWKSNYELSYEIFKEYTLIAYLSGNIEKSNDCRKIILENAKTNVEKLKLYHLELAQYTSIGRLDEAIETGIKAFALLGIDIQINTGKLAVIKEILEARLNLKNRNIEDLINGPQLKDEEKIVLMEICSELSLPLYYLGHENLYAVVVLKAVNISLKHGIAAISSLSFLGYSIILNGVLGDYKTSYEFGKLAMKINEKYNDIENRCQVFFVYSLCVHGWNNPLSSTVPYFKDAMEIGLQTGELIYVGIIGYMLPIWNTEYSIPESYAIAQENMDIAISYKLYDAVDAGKVFQQYRNNLMGKTNSIFTLDDSDFNTAKFMESMKERNFRTGFFIYYVTILKVYYMYESYEHTFETIDKADKIANTAMCTPTSIEYCFGIFINLSQNYFNTNTGTQKQSLRRMKQEAKKMTKWCDHYSVNTLHFVHIMNAEFSRIKGKDQLAIAHYKKAISHATEKNYIEYKVLSNELIARYYLYLDEANIATLYMTEAYFDYQLLGATGKQAQLVEKYGLYINLNRQYQPGANPSTVTTTKHHTHTTTGQYMDIETVAKAAQNLSSEVQIKSLLRKLMNLVQENAGAEKSVLILVEEATGQLKVQAKNIENDDIEIMSDDNLEQTNCVSKGIVNYVSRSHENVVLGEASVEGDFINDVYIQQNSVKSLLCMPILNQGNLIGVLYLENNMTSQSFTSERILVLNILCAQAAISIENAKLYENLELKVEERTEELSQKNRDIQSMLQNLHQGIFTIVEGNKIHPEYSRWLETIYDTKIIADQDAIDLLFGNSSISNDQRSQIENALDISIGDDAFQFELNRHILLKKMTVQIGDKEKILELEWDPIFNDDRKLEKVMVIVKDMTEIEVLQIRAEKQKTDLEKIGQILQMSI